MSTLHKSKRFHLISKLNDTSRYLDDIFTIAYHEFAKYILEIQDNLNKANTSDKEILSWVYI